MATDSSFLAWGIPRTEEPGGLQSIGVAKESDTTEQINSNMPNSVGDGEVDKHTEGKTNGFETHTWVFQENKQEMREWDSVYTEKSDFSTPFRAAKLPWRWNLRGGGGGFYCLLPPGRTYTPEEWYLWSPISQKLLLLIR